jgi:hypothetical protein
VLITLIICLLLAKIMFKQNELVHRILGLNIPMMLEEILFPLWFMKPIKATSLKLGTMNEVFYLKDILISH